MHLPTHDEIARHAKEFWQQKGCPVGRDDEIWLEAEQQLTMKPLPINKGHTDAHTLGESHSAHALAEKVSEQRKEALAPRYPVKSAPKAAPPETGKPLWSKPHSQ